MQSKGDVRSSSGIHSKGFFLPMKIKLSLKNQVLIGFGTILLITVVFAINSYFSVRTIKRETVYINQNIYPSLQKAINLFSEIDNLKRLTIDAIVQKDESFAEQAAQKGQTCTSLLHEISKADNHPLIDSLHTGLKLYISRTTELYNQAKQGEIDLTKIPDTRPFFAALQEYKTAKEKALDAGLAKIRGQASANFNLSVAFYLLLSLILIAFFLIVNMLTRSIIDLKRSTQLIIQGKLDQEIKQTRSDEMGDLQHNFDNMRITVKNTVENLDSLVKERTKEIADINDNVKIGLITIDESLHVGKTYSRFVTHILESDSIAEKSILDIIYPQQPDKQAKLRAVIELMFVGAVPIETLNELLPDKYIPYTPTRQPSIDKFLKLSFDLVDIAESEKKRLMVQIEDMTKELELQNALKEKEKESSANLALVAILTEHGVDTFQNFVAKHWKDLKEISTTLLEASNDNQKLLALKRTFHTIKGDAGAFGLKQVSSIAHEIENTFKNISDGEEKLDKANADNIISKTDQITRELQIIQGRIAHITGSDDQGETRGANPSLSVMIPVRKVNDLLDHIGAERDRYDSTLLQQVENFKLVPCRKLFNRFPSMIKSLAERLKKKVNELSITGGETLVDVELLEKIGDSMVHIMRNSIDHGIESPEERLDNGKYESGSIALSASIENKSLIITIKDDGRGIAIDKLKVKAIDAGLFSEDEWNAMSNDERYRIILYPNLSAKSVEEVSDISGRGIGMNVVQTVIEEELKGSIEIQSQEKIGTTFQLRIPIQYKICNDGETKA